VFLGINTIFLRGLFSGKMASLTHSPETYLPVILDIFQWDMYVVVAYSGAIMMDSSRKHRTAGNFLDPSTKGVDLVSSIWYEIHPVRVELNSPWPSLMGC
jgi:hypothetical protein